MQSEWLSASAAAAYVGPRRGGKPTHPVTIQTWWGSGLYGVVLQSEDRAGVRCTRPEWIDEFMRRVSPAARQDRLRRLRERKAKENTPRQDAELQDAATAAMQARRVKNRAAR